MIRQKKLGLGMGIDMEWNGKFGFNKRPDGKDSINERVSSFIEEYREVFNYLFIAFQPRSYNVLRAEEYFNAYDSIYRTLPDYYVKVFHHTLLNMGTMERYDRSEIFQFTNKLIDRYDIKWIVEDLGIWTIKGKPLPYPLPPLMTEEGLENCIKNVKEIMNGLNTTLCVEFPGYTEGTNFHIGKYNAYEFFKILSDETNCYVTLDIGHILSYQYLIGNTGNKMFNDLDKLPLQQCKEFHLSGCSITNGKFRDLHHGVLLNEQISLLEYLLPKCENLVGVTYEDPKYRENGLLIEKSLPNFYKMKEIVDNWQNCNQYG